MSFEYCRQRAVECVLGARRTNITKERRQTLIWAAYQWAQLAELGDRLEEVAEAQKSAAAAAAIKETIAELL